MLAGFNKYLSQRCKTKFTTCTTSWYAYADAQMPILGKHKHLFLISKNRPRVAHCACVHLGVVAGILGVGMIKIYCNSVYFSKNFCCWTTSINTVSKWKPIKQSKELVGFPCDTRCYQFNYCTAVITERCIVFLFLPVCAYIRFG